MAIDGILYMYFASQ